jgi:uncharacterized repeat protein (TIGR01451 family)
MYQRLLLLVTLLLMVVIAFGCTPRTGPTETTPPSTGTVAQVPTTTTAPVPQLSVPPAPATEPETTTAPAEPATTETAAPETPPIVVPVAQASPITVLSIVGGEVLVLSAGEASWHAVAVGTTLQPGDTIKTGSGSGAEITFFEGTTIELKESTQILVAEIGVSDAGSTTIGLKQQLGRTISRVQKLTDTGSRYEIETPAAIAAVRGSQMLVTVTASGRSEVGNLDGDIRVIVGGVDYTIHEGMKRTIIPGQKPGPEEPIDPPEAGGGGGPAAVLQYRMEVTMSAEPPAAHPGETITYTCLLNNVGDLPFHDIAVTNDVSGNATFRSGDVNADTALDPGETWVFTSTYTVREGDPPSLIATATISATTSTFIAVVQTETVTTTTLPDETPGVGLEKTASPASVHAGDNITYTYSVNNTGNIPLSQILVSDDRLGNIPFVTGDADADGLLDVGENWTFAAVYTAGDGDPGLLLNTANVTGTDARGRTVTAADSAGVAILRPGIALDKTADRTLVWKGDTVTYSYTVTNTGNTPLRNVSVSDDRLGAVPFVSGDTDADGLLDTDETWLFGAAHKTTRDDPRPLVNIATASAADDLAMIVTASDTVSVTIKWP